MTSRPTPPCHFAMKVTETSLRAAISFAPFL